VAGGGCKTDNKFFDLKKATTAVGGTQSEDDIKAACCTPFADATCADWTLLSCASGTSRVPTNSAPGDSSGVLSQADFRTKCCVSKCSAYSGAWVVSQVIGLGCKPDNKFFDLKKLDVTVGGTQSDSDIKAACCTRFADATCLDWNTMSCASGTSMVPTNSNLGDSSGALSQAEFRTKCCVDPVTTCSAYSGAWAVAQLTGLGCKPDNKFFDLKKSDVTVGGTQSDSDVKAACCTPFADATCADWNTRTCDTGKFRDGAVAAPTDGTTISDSEFKELCCKDPMTCADYVVETDAALSRTFPFAATFASMVGIFVL
jgi:hypothetical protein